MRNVSHSFALRKFRISHDTLQFRAYIHHVNHSKIEASRRAASSTERGLAALRIPRLNALKLVDVQIDLFDGAGTPVTISATSVIAYKVKRLYARADPDSRSVPADLSTEDCDCRLVLS